MIRNTAYDSGWQAQLHTARRALALVPFVVFMVTLGAFAHAFGQSPAGFAQLLMRVTAISMASSIVCVGVYGFYRYHLDKSHGL